MHSCACPSSQYACHAISGCVCRSGFEGADCMTPTRSALENRAGKYRERNKMNEFLFNDFCFCNFAEGSSAGVTWGIVVALTLVGVIIFVFLYFRRRVRNLKTEIAHVQYIADPSSQPDRHHFDNPVYDFKANGTTSTDNTNANLLNNLRLNKTSNLDRYLRGSDSGSNSSSKCK